MSTIILKRKLRDTRKHLRDLIHVTSLCITAIDAEMARPASHERGSRIAKILNELQLQRDIAKRYGLK